MFCQPHWVRSGLYKKTKNKYPRRPTQTTPSQYRTVCINLWTVRFDGQPSPQYKAWLPPQTKLSYVCGSTSRQSTVHTMCYVTLKHYTYSPDAWEQPTTPKSQTQKFITRYNARAIPVDWICVQRIKIFTTVWMMCWSAVWYKRQEIWEGVGGGGGFTVLFFVIATVKQTIYFFLLRNKNETKQN